jgi:hypothetical protein
MNIRKRIATTAVAATSAIVLLTGCQTGPDIPPEIQRELAKDPIAEMNKAIEERNARIDEIMSTVSIPSYYPSTCYDSATGQYKMCPLPTETPTTTTPPSTP